MPDAAESGSGLEQHDLEPERPQFVELIQTAETCPDDGYVKVKVKVKAGLGAVRLGCHVSNHRPQGRRDMKQLLLFVSTSSGYSPSANPTQPGAQRSRRIRAGLFVSGSGMSRVTRYSSSNSKDRSHSAAAPSCHATLFAVCRIASYRLRFMHVHRRIPNVVRLPCH